MDVSTSCLLLTDEEYTTQNAHIFCLETLFTVQLTVEFTKNQGWCTSEQSSVRLIDFWIPSVTSS